MSSRTIYVEDSEVWKKAIDIARIEGTSVSALISDYLAVYVRSREKLLKKVADARKGL
jgi:hypothetical protein